MSKGKFAFFIAASALIGMAVVFAVIKNIFALVGIAFIVISALSVAAGALLVFRLASWAVKKDRGGYIGDDAAPTTLGACKTAVDNYLRDNKTTAFFMQKLKTVIERLTTFGSRCNNIESVITERFGAAGLSYGKFAAPVAALQEHLVKLVNSLVSRMEMFDETEYRRRIGEFTMTNRTKEAESYKEVEQEYKDFTERVIMAFDDAILKLDRLTLEISKLGESDLDKAAVIMQDLDETIEHTQLYK